MGADVARRYAPPLPPEIGGKGDNRSAAAGFSRPPRPGPRNPDGRQDRTVTFSSRPRIGMARSRPPRPAARLSQQQSGTLKRRTDAAPR